MFRYKLLIFFLIASFSNSTQAANIKGRVILDESWAPVIYLSVIHSFDDLQTASYGFLRYKIELDSEGYFEADSLELAEGDLIYRLHVCKKGDPESSIIIGGKDENFIHFIMNKKSSISVIPNGPLMGLQYCEIQGQPIGNSLSRLFDLQKRLDTPPSLPSEKNRIFIKKQVLNEFQTMIDTSSNEVIKLLALHFVNESFANENHLELMEKVQNELSQSNYSSPYYDSFLDQLSFLRFQAGEANARFSWLKWIGILILIPFGFFISNVLKNRKNKGLNNSRSPIQILSKQEKRVYNLLKKGKSNKEISSELHIEVSTVKSHLHKIYSRLGVKSRKEIIDEER